SKRRHTRSTRDWSSDVCSSDLALDQRAGEDARVCRQAEEPEGEEGVEALPVPHAQKAPLRVARAHALAAGDGNAEVREHALQERSEERRVGKEGRCRGTGGQGR